MKSPVAFVKENPGKTILAVAIGAAVLVLMMRGGASDGGTSSSGGYSANQLAAAQQMAQINAAQASQNSQMQGQLAALQIQSATALQLAEIERDARNDELAVMYQTAQLQSAENLQTMHYQSELAQAQMSTQLEALNAQLANQLANQTLFVEGQVDLAQIAANVSIEALQSQVDIAQIHANRDVSMANNTRRGNNASLFAGVIGGIIGLFCDVRIKDVHGCVSTRDCLDAIEKLPLDRWSYRAGSVPAEMGDRNQHIGTYAQSFYEVLGVPDFATREKIEAIDVIGVLIGAVKELKKERDK
jgi:multidrug efflux pump subunit AcrA (membrane-fusion protein)